MKYTVVKPISGVRIAVGKYVGGDYLMDRGISGDQIKRLVKRGLLSEVKPAAPVKSEQPKRNARTNDGTETNT